MDDSIFSILDGLEAEARPSGSGYFPHPSQPTYNRLRLNSDRQKYHTDDPRIPRLSRSGDTDTRHCYDHDEYGDDISFDDFDQALLRQPDDDRRRQAQEGRARLSLLPAGSSQQHTQPWAADNDCRGGDQRGYVKEEHLYRMPRSHQPLANYYAAATQNSSPPKDFPSSPTMRVSQPVAAVKQPAQRRVYQRWGSDNRPHERADGGESSDELFVRNHEAETFQPDFIRTEQQPWRQRIKEMPVVQGIELVSPHELPDRFRTVFPFPTFNAVQSKCFSTIYGTNDNFVVSAPTGSGKTVIFELAILRLINSYANGSFKAVYQAPTKAICCERQKDWENKFKPLEIKVKELTGDTTNEQLRDVQTADLIITTPEKWDSMTRKWKDHERLVQMVKLFLIDEVHILKEDRGATLEAVVSRMKSIGTIIRFVALSATVPNFTDIAAWLGKNPMNQHIPAPKERFGEEFRPVKLQKHVIGAGGGNANQSEFAFDKILNAKLPGIIAKYSQMKPIIIFCFTRKSCEETAASLADWWNTSNPQARCWEQPRRLPVFEDTTLQKCVTAGVAFHHAGLPMNDKQAVETAYLAGELNVICCTSTLAVGVNLPCHFVIIKNTVTYFHPSTRECSDLEIMQMLGRAGRPQFDDSAVGVIITRTEKVRRYEMMVSGKEVLESRLHLNLVEHLNAEVGLGTVTDVLSAKKWLRSTFLYVRLQENPSHYEIEGDAPGSTIDERLEQICINSLELLRCSDLAEGEQKVRLTEYGDIMARYSTRLDTMQRIIALPPQAKLSEILTAIACASEFKEIRFRQNEKALYKTLNTSPAIKFPIPVNLDQGPQKISLIIQSVLGNADLPANEDLSRQRTQYHQDVAFVFQHTRRLVRCIVDCAIHKEDSVIVRNALVLSRSLYSKVWDDSPLTMKQLDSIGPVGVRKLVNAGIRSIDELEFVGPQRLETILGKHPPFGTTLLAKIRDFPKLRVSLKQMRGIEKRSAQAVTVNLKAEVGFINEKPPLTLGRGLSQIPLFICFMAETSDGKMVHFRRTSAAKLGKGQDVLFSAELTSLNQVVTCYVMCDDLAGTMKQATIQPEIPAHLQAPLRMNISKRRADNANQQTLRSRSLDSDEFGDGGLDDTDLVKAIHDDEFVDIEKISPHHPINVSNEIQRSQYSTMQNAAGNCYTRQTAGTQGETFDDREHKRLGNGKWACNHKCKNKQDCKHLCCKEGMDKAPNTRKQAKAAGPEPGKSTQNGKNSPNNKKFITGQKMQTKLNPSKNGLNTGIGTSRKVERLDLTGTESQPVIQARQGFDKLRAEAKRALPETTPVSVRISNKRPRHSYESSQPVRLSFLRNEDEEATNASITSDNDYSEHIEDMTSTQIYGNMNNSDYHHQHDDEYMFHGDGDLFADIMAGVAYLDQNPDPHPSKSNSLQTEEQAKAPEAAVPEEPAPPKEKAHSLVSSKSWSPDHQPANLMPVQERSNTIPLPRSSGADSSSGSSHRIPRKPLRGLDTASVRSESTSSRLRVMNPDPDPLSPEEPSPKVIAPGLEDVDPWLIQEFASYVNFT